jgi:penicillin amidase
MSPFYDAGHRAWEEGEPTPFLPGAERHRLTLAPAGQ